MNDQHHEACVWNGPDPTVSTCIQVTVGHRDDGSLVTLVRFASGEQLLAEAGNPDIGLEEGDTVLHDVVHTLLACGIGLDRSPVLERVVDIIPLAQDLVDLEEAAAFAIQALCIATRGDDPANAVSNARKALSSYQRSRAEAREAERKGSATPPTFTAR